MAEFTQEQEDAASRAAEEAVKTARENGETELDLSNYVDVQVGSEIIRPFSALTRLPPEISVLTELRHLLLIGTEVSDLSPLAGLSGLQGLYVDGSSVVDLAPLAELHDLSDLSLDATRVSDLSILRSLTGLQSL